MGVNDLIDQWESMAENYAQSMSSIDEGLGEAILDLERTARTAWHPVSEAPTEADSDENGYVFIIWNDGEKQTLPWWQVVAEDVWRWARIRDVVLMPPEE